jgi:hypothetical protein
MEQEEVGRIQAMAMHQDTLNQRKMGKVSRKNSTPPPPLPPCRRRRRSRPPLARRELPGLLLIVVMMVSKPVPAAAEALRESRTGFSAVLAMDHMEQEEVGRIMNRAHWMTVQKAAQGMMSRISGLLLFLVMMMSPLSYSSMRAPPPKQRRTPPPKKAPSPPLRRPYPTLTQSQCQPPILGERPDTVQSQAAAVQAEAAAETKTKETKIMEVAVVEAAAMEKAQKKKPPPPPLLLPLQPSKLRRAASKPKPLVVWRWKRRHMAGKWKLQIQRRTLIVKVNRQGGPAEEAGE